MKMGGVGKVADSLISTFKTRNGRIVRDGGGINPDINTKREDISDISISLMSKNLIFDFTTDFNYKNKTIPDIENFVITDEIFLNFVSFLQDKDYEYTTKTEEALEIFKEITIEEENSELLSEYITAITDVINTNKNNDLFNNKTEIIKLLASEIVSRYYYQEGRIKESIKHDVDIKEALKLFQNIEEYKTILGLRE